jgi:hypothetical protein
MTRRNRLRLAAVATAVLVASSIAGLAGPASAAPSGSSAAPAKAAVVQKAAGQKFTFRLSASSGYAVICYVYIDPTPYETGASYSGFRENIDASTTCTKPVTFLREQVYLFLNGGAWGYDSVIGNSYITGTASGPCLSGTYSGEVDVEIIWPAGVTGPPSYTARSNSIDVPRCI